jgi:GTP-binding protein
MKFIDEVELHIRSGNGGSGIVSFRREKFVPFGGPDGGDGGRGGHVILKVDSNLATLVDLRYQQKQYARNGRPGEGNQCTGADGEDKIIRVPAGTQVLDEHGTLLHDLIHADQEIVIAKGGRGGKGNMNFATPSRRTPDFAQPGEEGEELTVTLSLKLLADVSLIGFPNAGKSTLIRTVSNAKPRVADFPFTTIKPHLGVIRVDEDRSYVMADMPGLIEGASEGVGLGLRFLKHIERTGVFVFLLTRDYGEGRGLLEDFLTLRNELQKFDKALLERPFLIAISQCDRADVQDVLAENLEALS